MAEGDLTLTARLRLEVDPNQVRAELQKAGGIVGQAVGGGGGVTGGLAQRTGGGQDSTGQMLRVLGLGAVGGGAIVGSYVVLQRILRLMENAPIFGSTFDLLFGSVNTLLGSILDAILSGFGLRGPLTSLATFFYETSAFMYGDKTFTGFGPSTGSRTSYPLYTIPTGTSGGSSYYTQGQLDRMFQPTIRDTDLGPSIGTLDWLKNLGPTAAYAMEANTPAYQQLGSFMAQWGAENPGGAYNQWKGGPPAVFGMRSAGTYDTLASQLFSGARLAQTSQWGNTDIGAQGKWWGPSANSGDILSRIQKYYQIANYGGAVSNGWGWGDVSKQIEKMLSDPSAPKSGEYLMGNISSYIEPIGRTWSRTSEYGNFMSDVMSMGSPGITPPDIGTLFSGLTFAPEIKVTIGAQELNDIITQIIESGNFTTRTAI